MQNISFQEEITVPKNSFVHENIDQMSNDSDNFALDPN